MNQFYHGILTSKNSYLSKISLKMADAQNTEMQFRNVTIQ